jgi:N-dimethylarginine dimethylaminohydrolase
MKIGMQSEVGKIQSLLLKSVHDAFQDQASIDRQWQALNYIDKPDFGRAVDEYEAFVDLLSQFDIEISYSSSDQATGLDSIYVRDTSLVCDKGVILCNMGKAARQAEPQAISSVFTTMDVPILGVIEGDGHVEGGDVAWLNERTLAIAEGYRTNAAGITQLRDYLGGYIDELVVAPLPHWQGPGDVFHLMSTLSPIDADLCLVYSPLLTVPFRNRLLDLGFDLVEVPAEEFDSMACNVLAIAPRQCIMLDGNPITRRRLEDAGAEVFVYKGDEISKKGCGGPTCLTRPLLRNL